LSNCIFLLSLWWCVHDLTNRCRENLFPNNNIYLMEEAATYLKEKPKFKKTMSEVVYLSIWWKPTYLKKSPSSRRQMSEAHDTEQEKSELPETDEMGQEFLWSDNDKHSTTRCSKQARKAWYHYYVYVCLYMCI
jgi:hypothetical protein